MAQAGRAGEEGQEKDVFAGAQKITAYPHVPSPASVPYTCLTFTTSPCLLHVPSVASSCDITSPSLLTYAAVVLSDTMVTPGSLLLPLSQTRKEGGRKTERKEEEDDGV